MIHRAAWPRQKGALPVMGLMSADPISVSPDCTLQELITVRTTRHIGAVPVVADEKVVVGIVGSVDLLHTFKDVQDSALHGP